MVSDIFFAKNNKGAFTNKIKNQKVNSETIFTTSLSTLIRTITGVIILETPCVIAVTPNEYKPVLFKKISVKKPKIIPINMSIK